MNKNNINKFTKNSIMVLIIYLVCGVFLIRHYQYEGLNANTIGYLTVALEYARGNFYNAINGFWPPLISWLIVPFLKLGMAPLLAGRIVMYITGFFLLIGVRILTYRFELTEGVRNIILLVMVPITLGYIKVVFPDLLILVFIIFYLNIIFKNSYPDRISNGILSGVFGALAYFSKHFAFPFFVSHFVIFNALHYFRNSAVESKKGVLRNAVIGMALFAIISGAWILLISSKYNYLTIGTAGKYNLALTSQTLQAIPEFEGIEKGKEVDPVYYAGLLKPPYETALSTWDDPTYVSEKILGKIKPWGSIKYIFRYVVTNAYRTMRIFVSFFSFLSTPILIIYILFCIQPFSKLIEQGSMLYLLTTLVLYTGGNTLALVYIDTVRYLWIDNILLLLMGGHVLTVLFRSEFFSGKTRKYVLTAFFVLSFIFIPLRDTFQKPSRGENNFKIFRILEDRYNIHGNIASNDRWGDTLQLVYYLNLGKSDKDRWTYYYGMPKKNQTDEDLLKELKTHNIDYYIVWGDAGFLPGYEELTKGSVSDLKIYSLGSDHETKSDLH